MCMALSTGGLAILRSLRPSATSGRLVNFATQEAINSTKN